MELSGAFIID